MPKYRFTIKTNACTRGQRSVIMRILRQSCTGDDQANFEYFLEKIQTILNYWYKVSNFSFLHKAMPKQESSQLRPAEWSLRQ